MSAEGTAHPAPAEEPAHGMGKAVRQGFLWNLLNFAFSQGAGLVIFLLLSRQVTPAVFGVFTMAAILVDLFVFHGRWAAMDALVQRQDFAQRTLSTAFWSLQGVALALASIFFCTAPLIADAFGEPSVAPVFQALAGTMFLMPALAVMDAMIMRHLQFRAQALRNMAGTLAGGAAGLWFAFAGAAAWALVAQRVVSLVVALIVLQMFTKWRPHFVFDKAVARGFMLRAGQLWSSLLLATAHLRMLEAAIGARAGAASVGLLRAAQRFEEALHGPITGPLQALWVPILSKLRHDGEERRVLYLRLTQLCALVATPAFVGLGLVAGDLLPLLLDARYWDSAPLLTMIGLTGFIIPLGYYANLVFAGLDRSDLSMKFSVVALIGQTGAVWLAAGNGPQAAVAAMVGVGTVVSFAAAYVQTHLLGASLRSHLRALAPAYLATAVMMVCVFAAHLALIDAHRLARLSAEIVAGACGYGAVLWFLHRRWLVDVIDFVRDLRRAPAPEAELATA